MADVELLDEFGNLRVIDDSEAAAALAAGWRPESPEETAARVEAIQYGTIGEQLKGVGEQALSGATLGLSDVALAETMGDEYRTARAARERQLGGVATAAQVAGAIAPTLLTLGGSAPATGLGLARSGVAAVGAPVRAAAAAGRAGEALAGAGVRALGVTGESILGRGLLRGAEVAAGGAVEGALFGAGQAMSEAALAPGGNYDNLAAKMLAGAGTGAEFGAIGGGLLGFAGGAGGKLIQKGAQKLVGPGGLKSLLEKAGDEATIRALGSITPKEAADIGEAGISKMAREVRDATLKDGTPVFRPGATKDDIFERVQKAHKENGSELGAFRKELSEAVETSGRVDLRPDLDGFFTKMDDMVADAATGPKSMQRRAAKALEEVEGLRVLWSKGKATLEEVAAYRMKLDRVLRPPTKGAGIQVAPKNAEFLEAARRELENVVEISVERASVALMPERAGTYAAQKSRYAALSDAVKLGKRDAGREIARNRWSPFETLSTIGGAVTTAATGNIAGLAAGAGIGLGRRLWTTRGESLLAVVADRVARSDAKMQQAITRFVRRGGDVRRVALGAGGGAEVEAKSRVEKVLRQRSGQSIAKAYRKKLDAVSRYSPEADATLPALTSTAPQTAIAAIARMARARDYLLQTAPGDILPVDTLQPQFAKAAPNIIEIDRWARRLEAIEDPIGTIANGLEKGTLTREHVETVKTVDPTLYGEIRSKLEDELLQSKTRLPIQDRIRLGVLFELQTDPSLRPKQMPRTQRMYASLGMQQQQATPAASPPPMTTPNTALQTESQRIESGAVPQ